MAYYRKVSSKVVANGFAEAKIYRKDVERFLGCVRTLFHLKSSAKWDVSRETI